MTKATLKRKTLNWGCLIVSEVQSIIIVKKHGNFQAYMVAVEGDYLSQAPRRKLIPHWV